MKIVSWNVNGLARCRRNGFLKFLADAKPDVLCCQEIKLFEEKLGGFGLGDFHIDCNLIERKNSDSRRMDILIFYCPIRYEETP